MLSELGTVVCSLVELQELTTLLAPCIVPCHNIALLLSVSTNNSFWMHCRHRIWGGRHGMPLNSSHVTKES